MKKLLVSLFSILAAASLHAAITPGHPVYDPFADATASGGTAYTPGGLLIGQTNAQGLAWAGAGTSNNFQPKLVSGNLSVTGLAASTGNSASYGFASANTGDTGRLTIGGAMTNGTLYYSMILTVTGGLASGQTGAVIAGFNNSVGSQTGQPTIIDGRLDIRTNTGGTYNLGLDKSGLAAAITWDSTNRGLSNVVFVVVSYSYISGGASNDSASLWINPDPSTFGTATPPAPALTTSLGADATQIASFLMRQGSTLEPNLVADELRVGLTWADVTPPPAEAPAFSGLTASQSITAGATNIALSGHLSASSPLVLYPDAGETITVTIGGTNALLTTTDAAGDFSGSFNPSSIPASGTPYTITYSYSGNVFLGSATDTSTTLTVTTPVSTSYSITSATLDTTGTNVVLTWTATATTTYQVVATTNLTPPIVWTNIGAPITASGTNVTATNATLGPATFFAIKTQ